MMSYLNFARFYDRFTQNVGYACRAEYFDQVFRKYCTDPKLILDLACGTGSLSAELAKLGYHLIATDGSEEMLAIASVKTADLPVQLLLQDMRETSLPFEVDAVVCALDSINHLGGIDDFLLLLNSLKEVLKENGVFVFDVNTLFKHQQLLADNSYIFEDEEVFCCWQNSYNSDDHSVDILLDFFMLQSNGSYHRESEDFTECFLSHDEILSAVEKSGFELLDVFAEDSFCAPKKDEQRIIYIARSVSKEIING